MGARELQPETPAPANDAKRPQGFPRLFPPQRNQRRGLDIPAAAAIVLAYSIALVGAGIAGGVWAEDHDIPERLHRRVAELVQTARTHAGDDAQVVEWRPVETHLHSLDVARIAIGTGPTRGGGIVEIDGNLVFASPHGRLGYLNAQNRLVPIPFRVPMRLDAVRASPLYTDPLFGFEDYRVYDLYARRTGPATYDLYASHSQFVRENCFQFVVSKLALVIENGAITAPEPRWRTAFVARPGCIRYKDRAWRFVGAEAGGRMVPLDARTLLISIGDHQFDGFDDSERASQRPDWDLGKIIALDIPTGRSRIYAMGVRNPQGLFVTPEGDVWESEHGPQGGDEINFIRDGGNYGWPLASYGVNYGFPRRTWPPAHDGDRHGGFLRPAISFAPSIGASNLISPDAREFPAWVGDLLMGTLKARTLFHVRTEGDRVAYTEAIEFDERLRDIVSLHDGRIAILTDSSQILLLRNADLHKREPRSFTVTGRASLGGDPDENKKDQSGPERGRRVFTSMCAHCHSVTGAASVGPPLNGVIGRRVGSAAGFRYSRVMSSYRGVWTEDLILSFLTDPNRHFRGTAMPNTDIPWLEAPNVAAYLKTTRGNLLERTAHGDAKEAAPPPRPAPVLR